MILGSIAVLTALTAPVSAETRGTVRFGMLALDLEASSETPLFGGQVDRAVDEYNSAAAAYDRQTGGTTPRIDAGDLGVAERLFVISPGIEVSASHYLFRIEAPIGIADDLKSIGVGLYPIGLQGQLRRGLVLYLSAGGTASWLDRPGDGDVGGLFMLRAAAGARLAKHLVIEVGYGAFALGGSINSGRLDGMTAGNEMTLPAPDSVISAGEARGLVDASLGLTF
jgi:hypothetical protein